MFVGRTVAAGGVVLETELLGAGLGAVGGEMGLDLGTAFTLGPSEKSPQSSKASSSQVDAGGLLGLTGGFVGAFVLFSGALGGGWLAGASAKSPQSPNESSSHVACCWLLIGPRFWFFWAISDGCCTTGAESCIESESSKSIVLETCRVSCRGSCIGNVAVVDC